MEIINDIIKFTDGILKGFGMTTEKLLYILLSLTLIFFGVRLTLRFAKKTINKIISKSEVNDTPDKSRRVRTLMSLAKSVTTYTVYFLAILLVLSVLGYGNPVTNIAAFAGIISLAVGFGAQSLVQDVVTGLFMTFEDQYAVGEFVNINGDEGTVESIAMRVTYIRTFDGRQIIIPNGTIKKVINFSRGENLAQVLVSTAYESDTAHIIDIMKDEMTKFANENSELIMTAPEIQGVKNLNDSSVDIGVICRCHPMQQWEVERRILLAIKQRFDKEKIPFPYPHRTIDIIK